jgi:hypothetical protein
MHGHMIRLGQGEKILRRMYIIFFLSENTKLLQHPCIPGKDNLDFCYSYNTFPAKMVLPANILQVH